jgi:hypothetical protein
LNQEKGKVEEPPHFKEKSYKINWAQQGRESC